MIFVTKPFMPPVEDYMAFVRSIWERQWVTNNGPLVNQLELKLKEHLGLDHMLFVTNGTIALQIAIKALQLKGEIITTSFSYVATSSSIVWEGCKPVLVDIDPDTLNIDPAKIEQAITPQTSAILATHVYGNPCDIDAIQAIADKHKLKVIYDAAHCFGTKYKGKSIFYYGDVSTASFHATKLFHTVEGGAVFTRSAGLLKRMAFMRNFGHDGPEKFDGLGINGKNSEFHAAMGLANIPHIQNILNRRKQLSDYYDTKLEQLDVRKIRLNSLGEYNYAYYTVVFNNEQALLKSVTELNLNWIYPRRYFYPSLSTLSYINSGNTPIADDISTRVLCLPLYSELSKEEADLVCRIMLRAQNN